MSELVCSPSGEKFYGENRENRRSDCAGDGGAVAAAVATVRFEVDCSEERVASATNCKGSVVREIDG